MHRRDLALISRTIDSLPLADERRAMVALRFADSIAAEHPSFNRAKFFSACKVKIGEPANV